MPHNNTKKRIYEIQNKCTERPAVREIKMVWINIVSPTAKGWESWVNKIDRVRNKWVGNIKMSENSFIKILVLGIKDEIFVFFSEVLRK